MPWKVDVNGEILAKFWPFVDKSRGETACWIYTGSLNATGYGVIYAGKNSILAHRLSYAIHHGRIPDGANVLHTCDTPACVQPLHLWPGTHADNVRDMDSKGRRGSRQGHRGEKNPLSKLTDVQVASLRERYSAGGVTQKQLAAELGVTRSAVGAWISGKRAGTTSISRPPREYTTRGESHYEGKLDISAVRSIREIYAAGHKTMDELATAYKVTKQMVWRIIHRKAWTHVE